MTSTAIDLQSKANPQQLKAILATGRPGAHHHGPGSRRTFSSLTEEQYLLWLSDPLALYGVENAKLAPATARPREEHKK